MIEEVYLIDYSAGAKGGFKGDTFPPDTIVVFKEKNGDKYEISRNKDDIGVSVRLTRKGGLDQMTISPRSSNEVYVK